MKVVQINTFSNGSTGALMMNIHQGLLEAGEDSYVIWARGRNPRDDHEFSIKDKLGMITDGIVYSRILDRSGFGSARATHKLLDILDRIHPDIVHVHNLHGYYLNIEILFTYLNEHNIPVVWTLHDCWGFTGHCSYFDSVQCTKWKTGCHDCELKKTYPSSLFRDNSANNYRDKKRLFTSHANTNVVVPSKWLARLVKQSFLGTLNCITINNGIDHTIFRVLEDSTQWKRKQGLADKKIVLGVASEWSYVKGLSDMVSLSRLLDDSFKVVIVGVSKKQKAALPKNVIGIEKTENVNELVEIYNSADYFMNPTYSDNFPTVNIEALSCGAPVITYNTGGSPEALSSETGKVIEQGNVHMMADLLNSGCEFDRGTCAAQGLKYDIQSCLKKYLELYKAIIELS